MAVEPAVPIDEKRAERRHRSLLAGRIVFLNGNATLDCTIRNMSESGAMLLMPSTVALPHHFELIDRTHDRSYMARVVWRKEDRAGVAFDKVDGPRD